MQNFYGDRFRILFRMFWTQNQKIDFSDPFLTQRGDQAVFSHVKFHEKPMHSFNFSFFIEVLVSKCSSEIEEQKYAWVWREVGYLFF